MVPARTIIERILPIVYEDEHMLFVSKPAGLEISTDGEAPTSVIGQALDLVRSDRAPLHLICRSARAVSGLAGFAKDADTATRWRSFWQARAVEQRYLAVVHGTPGKDLVRNGPRPAPRPRSRDAPTPAAHQPRDHFVVQVRKRVGHRSLIVCRTHGMSAAQVGERLRAAGHAVIGDPVVRARHGKPGQRTKRQGRLWLHLLSLRLAKTSGGRRIEVASPIPESLERVLAGAPPVDDALHNALAARLGCVLDHETDAWRLIGGGEGVSGLVAEKFGRAVFLQVMQGKFQGDRSRLQEVAAWYGALPGVDSVHAHHVPLNRSYRSAPSPDNRFHRPLIGTPPSAEIEIREQGLRFRAEAANGQVTGLFLDQRHNRQRVRELAAGRRVLNAFCYTCGFSVAAAAGGAAQTINVDISRRFLDWGKENFRRNGLALDHHVFLATDALSYCRRAARQGRTFDLIILDVPTFARVKKPRYDFRAARDLARLLGLAVPLAERGAHLLISVNHRSLSHRWLIAQVASVGRPFRVVETPELPEDFAPDPDYAKSVWVRLR